MLQVNIAEQLNAIESKALNKKKNADYAKFLDVTNRKPAIFRDIIIESECNIFVKRRLFEVFHVNCVFSR